MDRVSHCKEWKALPNKQKFPVWSFFLFMQTTVTGFHRISSPAARTMGMEDSPSYELFPPPSFLLRYPSVHVPLCRIIQGLRCITPVASWFRYYNFERLAVKQKPQLLVSSTYFRCGFTTLKDIQLHLCIRCWLNTQGHCWHLSMSSTVYHMRWTLSSKK